MSVRSLFGEKFGGSIVDNIPVFNRLLRSSDEALTVEFLDIEGGGTIGEELNCRLSIKGGGKDIRLNQIEVSLVLNFSARDKGGNKQVRQELSRLNLGENKILPAGAILAFPVKFKLPYDIPVSTTTIKYSLEANLDIQGVKELRQFPIEIIISPNNYLGTFLEVFGSMGFKQGGEAEYINRYQVFNYLPPVAMRNALGDLRLFISCKEKDLSVILDINKLISGSPNRKQVKFTLPCAGMQSSAGTANTLRRIIAEI
ncbi:MAG TPA: sporulation protein [Verrucomicrobiae bacterium]|nr:sporulation protein [Verrucomicrobiae bacterium]